MHHVPHTGDLPNTVFTSAHSSVMLSPINYLPGDPSRQTVNMVRLNYGDGNTSLHLALVKGRQLHHIFLVPILLKYGASINLQNKHGFTPLHILAEGNTLEARLLQGDNQFIQPSFARQVQHEVQVKYREAFLTLFESGADLSVRDNGTGTEGQNAKCLWLFCL